jgi:hypothetical protein
MIPIVPFFTKSRLLSEKLVKPRVNLGNPICMYIRKKFTEYTQCYENRLFLGGGQQ